mmetsp:Transcript_110076/g.351117  ORF Transcript_110076/g.351117 Transcript_110076/m.351117 type:complete len:363 (+) Transcript_110076:1137-2225(+)
MTPRSRRPPGSQAAAPSARPRQRLRARRRPPPACWPVRLRGASGRLSSCKLPGRAPREPGLRRLGRLSPCRRSRCRRCCPGRSCPRRRRCRWVPRPGAGTSTAAPHARPMPRRSRSPAEPGAHRGAVRTGDPGGRAADAATHAAGQRRSVLFGQRPEALPRRSCQPWRALRRRCRSSSRLRRRRAAHGPGGPKPPPVAWARKSFTAETMNAEGSRTLCRDSASLLRSCTACSSGTVCSAAKEFSSTPSSSAMPSALWARACSPLAYGSGAGPPKPAACWCMRSTVRRTKSEGLPTPSCICSRMPAAASSGTVCRACTASASRRRRAARASTCWTSLAAGPSACEGRPPWASFSWNLTPALKT